MADLIFTRERRPFTPGRPLNFVFTDDTGPPTPKPTASAYTPVAFEPADTNYTPAASFTPWQWPEATETPAPTPNQVTIEPDDSGTYTPGASFTMAETNLDHVDLRGDMPNFNQAAPNFDMRPGIGLDIAHNPQESGATGIEITVPANPYTPEPLFELRRPENHHFYIDPGSYTPEPNFYIPDWPNTSDEAEATINDAIMNGTLPALDGSFVSENIAYQATIAGTLPILSGSIAGSYDYNVIRPLRAKTLSEQQNTTADYRSKKSLQEESEPTQTPARSVQEQATKANSATAISVDNTTKSGAGIIAKVEQAANLASSTTGDLQNMDGKARIVASEQKPGTQTVGNMTALFDILTFKRINTGSDVVNAFEKQTRHLRTYYNPIEPWTDYTPTANFTIDQHQGEPRDDIEIAERPDPQVLDWFNPTVAPVDEKPVKEMIRDQELTYRMTRQHYDIDAAGTINFEMLEIADAGERYRDIVYRTWAPEWHLTEQLNDPEPTFTRTPNPSDRAPATMEHIHHPGRVVFGTFINSDTKGLIHNKAETLWQYATWKCFKWIIDQEFTRKTPTGRSPWIDLPRPDPDPEPPTTPGQTVVPIKKAYRMKNTISVTLEDLTPIGMDELSLSFDADSHSWQFSGRLLDPADAALIKPDANGNAVTLIVTINGYEWKVLAERAPETREFANRSVSVSGRGISSLISDSYKQPTTGTQGSDLTVAQLAETHKPVGWTINWQAADWLVPGGAYSWQNRAPLQAINDLAQFAGAMVVPDRSNQVLNIKPRYPALPWNFDGITPDVTIPDSAIKAITTRTTSKQYPNAVYVHGGEIGGEIGYCRLNGTAGDILIQTDNNPIMTDPTGLRARGERLLAGEYPQPDIESITTFMDGSTVPLFEVGNFIEATIDGAGTRGVVSGVSINASRPTVTQTIRIGEDTGNQWRKFTSLLPADPLLIGTIASTNGNTSTITLLGGGVMNVRGTGTVGQKVYIRSGQIQGEAPNLTETEIII